jgi:hypothetical protein
MHITHVLLLRSYRYTLWVLPRQAFLQYQVRLPLPFSPGTLDACLCGQLLRAVAMHFSSTSCSMLCCRSGSTKNPKHRDLCVRCCVACALGLHLVPSCHVRRVWPDSGGGGGRCLPGQPCTTCRPWCQVASKVGGCQLLKGAESQGSQKPRSSLQQHRKYLGRCLIRGQYCVSTCWALPPACSCCAMQSLSLKMPCPALLVGSRVLCAACMAFCSSPSLWAAWTCWAGHSCVTGPPGHHPLYCGTPPRVSVLFVQLRA